jgi:dTDP-4-amino-4,6-dideoxygalactose transaminase
MHRRPVFRDCPSFGVDVADDLFERGLHLPSDSNLTAPEQERLLGVIRGVHRARAQAGA